MTVLSRWSASVTSRSKASPRDSTAGGDEDIASSVSNLSLLTDDPYASRNRSDTSLSSSQATDLGPPLGTLIIVVMKAKNLVNRRAISKQNPYCSIRVAKHNDRTQTITRGGQAPVWDHETRFRLNAEDDNRILKLCVFDQNGSTTDIIGDALVQLKPALESSPDVGYDNWFPIHFNKKYVGEVYLEMTFYPAKQPSRRSSTASSVSSKHNVYRHSATGSSTGVGSVLPAASVSRSTSPIRSNSPAAAAVGSSIRSNSPIRPNSATRSNSPVRSSSPLRSSTPVRSSLAMKHSESMPILREHALPSPQSHDANHSLCDLNAVASNKGPNTTASSTGLGGSSMVPASSPYGTSYNPSPSSSFYGNSNASHSAASLQRKPSPRRGQRPLPQVPAETVSDMPRYALDPPASAMPSLPPMLQYTYNSSSSADRAQEDISKQINDGYEASLFERLKP